ncbi:MAG: heme o synthase, partial [Flavobacteriales bacterium]
MQEIFFNLKAENVIKESTAPSKVTDLGLFFKLKLSLIVVLSAVLGYFMGADHVVWQDLISLIVGGTLLTGASNGFNQVWERNIDKKMSRTMNRPLPTGRMSVTQGLVIASLTALAGIAILYFLLNPISALLGFIALFSYVLLYTPMKAHSPIAVFVGAFPGAIPPMLGYVAATNDFGVEPGSLFAVQFMWQFPHFWAIAWVAHEDYLKAGYRLLPFRSGQNKQTAFQILLYSLFLIPVSLLPWVLPMNNPMVGNVAMA